jgi:predicted phage baseplate assembly protein
MSLPIPDLDDRRFQDLVDEAKRMIPQLTPEWTNHNVADPGVALIELFAWMSEQVIFRLNQVPERLYVQFLDMMGVAPFPASASRVPLTFLLSGVPTEPVTVPQGTEVATADGSTVFATLDELRIVQPRLVGALTTAGETVVRDVLEEFRYDRDAVTCFPSDPVTPGDALNLGFDTSLAGQVVDLRLTVTGRGVGVDPARVPIVWEVWTGDAWAACTVLRDDTGGLNRDGSIRLDVPGAHEAMVLSGQRLHWLRVRLLPAGDDQPTFRTSPIVADITVSVAGGSVLAEHSRTVRNETLGVSDGSPGQRFALGHAPVLPREAGEHIVVFDGEQQQVYGEVEAFSASGALDHHVVWDPSDGAVEFGPSIRYPDGTTVQHGAVPPFGARVTVSHYRAGGGTDGNVGARALTSLRVAVPFVDSVANLVPARGGVDPERLDEVKLRGPRTVRAGQRAVTVSDYEQLALEASPAVARTLCVSPDKPFGPIRVLVVPGSTEDPELLTIDDFALSEQLYVAVRDRLEAARTLGATVEVSTPFYQGVSPVVRVRGAVGRSPVAVKERATAAIHRFLSPVDGGPRGDGWPFGTDLSAATLVSVLSEVEGIAGVDELALFELDLRNGRRVGDACDVIHLDAHSLFLAGKVQVVVR